MNAIYQPGLVTGMTRESIPAFSKPGLLPETVRLIFCLSAIKWGILFVGILLNRVEAVRLLSMKKYNLAILCLLEL